MATINRIVEWEQHLNQMPSDRTFPLLFKAILSANCLCYSRADIPYIKLDLERQSNLEFQHSATPPLCRMVLA